jgi:hypothetical protein
MSTNISKNLKRTMIFLIMLLILTGTSVLVHLLLEHDNHDGVMIVSTVVPAIVFTTATWLYLRVNWAVTDNLSQQTQKISAKYRIIAYVLAGFLLGIPAMYFIMNGVTKSVFSTVFPIGYIFIMSVYTIAFLPGFLKTTETVAPMRFVILAVALIVILLKVGVYLNSYFPGTITDVIVKNLFFALGGGNILLLFLLHSAWHQVFKVEPVKVVTPLNEVVVYDVPLPTVSL